MFEIGDQVCYPMHGVGIVEEVKEQEVLGEKALYYMLRFVLGRMTAMVPVTSAENVGLRPVISADECNKVRAYMLEDTEPESDNWNQRYRENLEKLRQGDIYGVADVVKCLIKRDQEKGLSAGERKMFLTAKQVLLAELVAASGKEEEDFKKIIGE
ncbi:CarD family transcriptional regulator [Christensenellaceae bacterium OttesenSCG-928-M15]|nr:CarD family transcriptional regulator [Christensenellaceae bacterium OttesenSCG-928-M15]